MVLLASHEWPAQTDAGAAAPVAVLVHGMDGSWRTWWRVAPELAHHGWRCVAVDLRGHGDSPRIEFPVTREDMAVDLGDTVEALDAAPCDVVIGHSLGAAVALELAHARPELLRRVVLEDPPGTDRRDDRAFHEELRRGVEAAVTDPQGEIERVLAANPTWLSEDAVADVEGRRRCDIDGLVASLRKGMGSRVCELAPILTVPALYMLAAEARSAIWGEERRALLDGVPAGSKAVELDAGHVIHRDRFDDYMRTLLDWLAETARS